jgi:L-ascorbate metabolism protein UlaG (beta-lactamase superfamily)
MDLSLRGHACARLEKHGSVLVIDPGAFSAPDAADDADLVLITHGHPDHVVVDRLVQAMVERPALQVCAPHDVAAQLAAAGPGVAERVRAVADGDGFEAAGFTIEVLGELHAVVHPDLPRLANVAYLVDGAVLHPGDSFTRPRPGQRVDVLLLPVAAPWLKLAESVEHARAVEARVVVPIHDATLNPAGTGLVDRVLTGLVPGTYTRLADGAGLTVD